MFYSHTILARKSPLGTVWIAAHLERKIKRPLLDVIDIPAHAENIMFPEVPIALRLSGHLLLGLVRIYSWKVNYLFQDCNRMLSTIRTAFASVQVDLPFEADRAPFESITLPDTFNLDDLNLDDVIRQIDTPDKHRRSQEQITLDEDYVMIDLDEGAEVEPSPLGRFSDMGAEPTEEETFPPFSGFEASDNHNKEKSVEPPLDNLAANPSNINQTDEAQDSPEQMREAPLEGPELNLPEFDGVNNDPMDVTQEHSPFMSKHITPPEVDGSISPFRGLSGTSTPKRQGTTSATHDDIDDYVPMHIEIPDLRIEPSPTRVEDTTTKRQPKVQRNKRKRTPKFDCEIVLPNSYLKARIDGDLSDIARKRRRLPHTAVDMWKFSKIHQKDFLLEPLVHGMCGNLHEIYERSFPHASDSEEPAAPQVSEERSAPGNADNITEPQPNPNSPENTDGQPEPELSPKSPGNINTSQDEDMTLEFPRFSPGALSPIMGDDTPFKTPGGTQSGHGGTFASRTPAADTSISPGQNTRDSDPMVSPFPINDELDEDLPEIPGLMSTPGVISTAGTGTTGLGSMSTRTRAVAQYFKDQMASSTPDGQPGKFSLNRILEGRLRNQAARMFFETLALKSYDYIDVQQDEPYGDIAVSVKPSLSAAKF